MYIYGYMYMYLLFLETIWVILQVDAGGILSVTQQMSRFGSDFSHPTEAIERPMVDNPFATPTKLSSSLPNSLTFSLQVSLDILCLKIARPQRGAIFKHNVFKHLLERFFKAGGS